MKKILKIILVPVAIAVEVSSFIWVLIQAILIALKYNGLDVIYWILWMPVALLGWFIWGAYVLFLCWNLGYIYKWAPDLMGFLDRYLSRAGWRLHRKIIKMRDYDYAAENFK